MQRRSVQTSLRESNSQRVLDVLRGGAATQADIARSTELSGATVSTIVRDLLDAGAIVNLEHAGRGQLVQLTPASGLAAGLAFGHARALVVLGDLTSEVLGERAIALPHGMRAEAAVATALAALEELTAEQGVGTSALSTVGVSLATPLVGGTSAAHFDRWSGHDMHALLSRNLSCSVLVDNDANLGARAELRWGELRGVRHGAWLKASTGIGVGLVLDGHIYRGAKGIAGELGHVRTRPYGSICYCGNRGCVEQDVAAPVLARQYQASTGHSVSGAELAGRALDGDVVARRLVEEAGAQLGEALAGLVTLLDPERIVVGGDLARAGDLLLDAMSHTIRLRAMPAAANDVSVAVSSLGDRAEVLGALALALDHAVPTRPTTTR